MIIIGNGMCETSVIKLVIRTQNGIIVEFLLIDYDNGEATSTCHWFTRFLLWSFALYKSQVMIIIGKSRGETSVIKLVIRSHNGIIVEFLLNDY